MKIAMGYLFLLDMCFSISTDLDSQLHRAYENNDAEAIKRIVSELDNSTDLPLHFTSGFAHQKMLIYTNWEPNIPKPAYWGLIPKTMKTLAEAHKIWNMTLNARGETLFEKKSFKDAIKYQRCVIYVRGFFEYYHFEGKKYPYFIQNADSRSMPLAGIWSEWTEDVLAPIYPTFSIITTEANPLMAKIHNNPKIDEPRMPVILEEDFVDLWLDPNVEQFSRKDVEPFLQPYSQNKLKAFTVPPLTGKQGVGNTPSATEKFTYPELK